MNILVVDDELVSRRKMEVIMTSYGTCETAETGEAAMAAFCRAWETWSPFDLITLDVSMPGMDGTEVLYRIREMETEKGVPVSKKAKIIMVTGQLDKSTIVTCIQAGCDGYVSKPFDGYTVRQKIIKLGLVKEPHRA
jgi:two-component system chemotaxis response regulator CheY